MTLLDGPHAAGALLPLKLGLVANQTRQHGVLKVGYVSDADFHRRIALGFYDLTEMVVQTFTRFGSQYGLQALSELGSIT